MIRVLANVVFISICIRSFARPRSSGVGAPVAFCKLIWPVGLLTKWNNFLAQALPSTSERMDGALSVSGYSASFY